MVGPTRQWNIEPVRWLGWLGLASWAALVGYNQVRTFSFFSVQFFFFFFYFLFWIFGFNSNLFCRNFKFMTCFKI
jgi:hypothetical protein